MILKPNNDKIRYTGRWNINEESATSTANGNYFEFKYKGDCAVLGFDISYLRTPYPHIYVCVDEGSFIEVSLERYIRLSAPFGEHIVKVILKSSVESQHRWYHPLEAKVSLLDIEADEFLDLSPDKRPVIEFIGDSITEGISIDVRYFNYGGNKDMVYWDDSTAGYAWLTAEKLNFRPVIMGYGCLGLTNRGGGNIPPVNESYGFYSDGYPIEKKLKADFIVINHGTNDRRADKNIFIEKYYEFLCTVRKINKDANIISLTPFSGCLSEEIKTAVEKYNKEKNDNVFYIDSTSWISPEPIHPLREGHKAVSEKLSEIIRTHLI